MTTTNRRDIVPIRVQSVESSEWGGKKKVTLRVQKYLQDECV